MNKHTISQITCLPLTCSTGSLCLVFTAMTTVADLRHILGLDDPLEHSTCIGHGQRNPYCHNAVASASRPQADLVLHTIARSWGALSSVEYELQQLASLLLCKRNPQWQAEAKFGDWERKTKNAAMRSAQAGTSRASSRTTLASPSRTSRSLTSHADSEDGVGRGKKVARSMTDKDLMQELRRRLPGTTNQKILDGFLELADDVNATSEPEGIGDDDGNDDDDDDDTSNDLQGVQSATQIPRQTPSHITTSTPAAARTQHRPSIEALRQARLAALSKKSGCTTSTLRSGPRPPLRQSHVECVVCLQPYDGDRQDAFWQCDKCMNRVHGDCFDAWCASIEPGRVVGCIHCRAEV